MSISDLKDHDATCVTRLVDHVLECGWSITVNDGEENVLVNSTDREKILSTVASTDEDQIRVHNAQGKYLGWFRLIWGNDPGETIADHTSNGICANLFDNATLPWREADW